MKTTGSLSSVLTSNLGLGLWAGDFGHATSPLGSDEVQIHTLAMCY